MKKSRQAQPRRPQLMARAPATWEARRIRKGTRITLIRHVLATPATMGGRLDESRHLQAKRHHSGTTLASNRRRG